MMTVQNLFAIAVVLMLPALAAAQHYQVAAPAYQPTFQPSYNPTPVSPMPTAPRMPLPSAAPAGYGGGSIAGNFCDSGGCDSYGGGGYIGAGYGGAGAGNFCDSGGCDSFGGGIGGGHCGGFDGGIGGGDCGSASSCGSGFGGNTYFSVFGGASELDEQNSVGFQRDLNINYDTGYLIGGAIGRRLFRNLRSELEYTFRSQDATSVVFNGNPVGNVGEFQNSHSAMFNLVYDLVLGNGNFVPYIGVGAGLAFIDSRVTYGTGVASLDGNDSSAAYQWMAGLAWRARPNMEAFVEYRFFEVMDPKLNRFGGPGIGFSQNPNILLESEYQSNDIVAGLRFNF